MRDFILVTALLAAFPVLAQDAGQQRDVDKETVDKVFNVCSGIFEFVV